MRIQYQDIVSRYENEEMSKSEAVFFLVNRIINDGVVGIFKLPEELEIGLIDVTTYYIITGKMGFRAGGEYVDKSVLGQKLVDGVDDYLKKFSNIELKEYVEGMKDKLKEYEKSRGPRNQGVRDQ